MPETENKIGGFALNNSEYDDGICVCVLPLAW